MGGVPSPASASAAGEKSGPVNFAALDRCRWVSSPFLVLSFLLWLVGWFLVLSLFAKFFVELSICSSSRFSFGWLSSCLVGCWQACRCSLSRSPSSVLSHLFLGLEVSPTSLLEDLIVVSLVHFAWMSGL